MGRLQGKRAVVTQAQDFMGPAIIDLFREEGAQVIDDRRDLKTAEACESLIAEAGNIDVLIVNLSTSNLGILAHETTDAQFLAVYEALVFPLQRLTRAILPQMLTRKSGKIVVVGSANGIKGMGNRSSYGSARGAQHAYVRNVGIETAPQNVQVNATAQMFVENPTYFPPEMTGTPELNARLTEVPAGRLSTAREAASLIVYLSSSESDFISGQIFPYAGGWVV